MNLNLKLFYKKDFVKALSKLTGKHLCCSSFFKKNWPSEDKKKDSSTGVFSWALQNLSNTNFEECLQTSAIRQILSRSSAIIKLLALRFKLILLIILKLGFNEMLLWFTNFCFRSLVNSNRHILINFWRTVCILIQRRSFNVYKTSIRCSNDVVCLLGKDKRLNQNIIWIKLFIQEENVYESFQEF